MLDQAMRRAMVGLNSKSNKYTPSPFFFGKSDLPPSEAGGTWKRTGPIVNQKQPIEIKMKLQIYDEYDWHAGDFFNLPVNDGQQPSSLPIFDDWQLQYETISNTVFGGPARKFKQGTKYTWIVKTVNAEISNNP
jgi:hypothetical protein